MAINQFSFQFLFFFSSLRLILPPMPSAGGGGGPLPKVRWIRHDHPPSVPIISSTAASSFCATPSFQSPGAALHTPARTARLMEDWGRISTLPPILPPVPSPPALVPTLSSHRTPTPSYPHRRVALRPTSRSLKATLRPSNSLAQLPQLGASSMIQNKKGMYACE